MNPLPEWLAPLLCCPVCRAPLTPSDAGAGAPPELRCATDCGEPGVRRSYRVEDGIPVLLADEARIIRA